MNEMYLLHSSTVRYKKISDLSLLKYVICHKTVKKRVFFSLNVLICLSELLGLIRRNIGLNKKFNVT